METIGDAYMVAAGLLDTSQDHAEAITNMAFDMREEASQVKEPANEEPLQVGDVRTVVLLEGLWNAQIWPSVK